MMLSYKSCRKLPRKVYLLYCPTTDMLADRLTKSIPKPMREEH